MSEHEKRHEHANSSEHHIDISREVEANLRELEAKHESNRADSLHEQSSEQFKHEAESLAQSSEDILQENEKLHETAEVSTRTQTDHATLKQETYRKTLQRTQAQLPPFQRKLSTFLHHPVVESASEIASKTVARPTGITWGSISTTIGITVSLFFAYRYGFSYNYLLFVLLFVAGYIISTALELGFSQLKKLRRNTSNLH